LEIARLLFPFLQEQEEHGEVFSSPYAFFPLGTISLTFFERSPPPLPFPPAGRDFPPPSSCDQEYARLRPFLFPPFFSLSRTSPPSSSLSPSGKWRLLPNADRQARGTPSFALSTLFSFLPFSLGRDDGEATLFFLSFLHFRRERRFFFFPPLFFFAAQLTAVTVVSSSSPFSFGGSRHKTQPLQCLFPFLHFPDFFEP